VTSKGAFICIKARPFGLNIDGLNVGKQRPHMLV